MADNSSLVVAPARTEPDPPQPVSTELDLPSVAPSPLPAVSSSSAAWPAGLVSAGFHLLLLAALWISPGKHAVERVALSGSRFVMTAEATESLPTEVAEPIRMEVAPPEVPETSPPTTESSTLPEIELEAPEVKRPEPADDAEPTDAVQAPPEVPQPTEQSPQPAANASQARPAAARSTPTNVGLDDLTPAEPVRNPPPDYPREALQQRWSGRVLLRLSISARGEVTSVEVVQSSGHAVLDNAATDAVTHWTFQPARRGTQSVASSALLPVRFQAR